MQPISSGDSDSGSNDQNLASAFTKYPETANKPRHRLAHLIGLDERHLIDIQVAAEAGLFQALPISGPNLRTPIQAPRSLQANRGFTAIPKGDSP